MHTKEKLLERMLNNFLSLETQEVKKEEKPEGIFRRLFRTKNNEVACKSQEELKKDPIYLLVIELLEDGLVELKSSTEKVDKVDFGSFNLIIYNKTRVYGITDKGKNAFSRKSQTSENIIDIRDFR